MGMHLVTSALIQRQFVLYQSCRFGSLKGRWCRTLSASTYSGQIKVALKRSFQVGDQVYLKMQPHVQTSLAPRANQNLAFK